MDTPAGDLPLSSLLSVAGVLPRECHASDLGLPAECHQAEAGHPVAHRVHGYLNSFFQMQRVSRERQPVGQR